jgi:steroid 5-alpha reductase family enzyme
LDKAMLAPADIATDAATLGGINVLLWLVSLPLGKTWPVDFIWSGWPPIMCAVIVVRVAISTGQCLRLLVVCSLVAIWGYRLTHNFVARGGIGHEDWRYADMRAQFGGHFWWISLFSVFLGQTTFLFAACLSLYPALESPLPLCAYDAAGAAVCLCAILLEAISDLQMDWHQAARREKKSDTLILRTGLWAWSRHPNYLGELMFWWGLWLFGAPAAPTWVLCAPLSITFLFTVISVKLLEDRQLTNKGELYRSYQREVPSPLLLLPPTMGRKLGQWIYGEPVPAMG